MENADLQALLDENPAQSTSELASALNVDRTTVTKRLHDMRKIHKEGKWIPYQLSENAIADRLNICISLFARQKKKSFLYRIITGDEKNHGLIQASQQHPLRGAIFTVQRYCCVFGGIKKILCTTNC